MKKICLSLLLMAGVSVSASEGPGSGGADKHGRTDTGAKQEDKDYDRGATSLSESPASVAMADGGVDSAGSQVDSGANRFTFKDKVFNDSGLLKMMTGFLSGRDSIRLGMASKRFKEAGLYGSRFLRAARAVKPIILHAHKLMIMSLSELSDGRVVSTSFDGSVKLLNINVLGGNSVLLVQGEMHQPCVVAVLPGDRLAVGFNNSSVQIVDPNAPDRAPLQLGHAALDGPIKAMTVLPSGRLLGVVAGWLYMWGPAAPNNEPEFLLNDVNRVALLSNGSVVIIRLDGSIMMWNPLDPVADSLLLGRSEFDVKHLLALSDGNFILVSLDGCIQMWNPAKPDAEPVSVGRCHRVISLAALRNGSFVTGSSDGRIYMWDPATPGADPVLLRDFAQRIKCLVVLRDGRIVAGLHYGTVQVLPTEEYFKWKEQDLREKVFFRTHDPGDYERDGTAVYDILFDNYAFNRWFDRKIQGQMVTMRDLVEKIQSRFSTEEVRQNARDEKIEMQNEIVDVVKLWLNKNFALEDEDLTAQNSSQADLLIVQAKKIVEGLLHQQLIDTDAQRIELFGRDQSVSLWLDLLQTFVKQYEAHVKQYEAQEKRNAFYGIPTRRALYPGESLSDYQKNVFDSGCSATERDLPVEGCESQASVVAVEDSFTQWNGYRGY